MSVLNQKTIKDKITFTGIGLHSGQKVDVLIKPSEPNTGIIFKRVDLKENNIDRYYMCDHLQLLCLDN